MSSHELSPEIVFINASEILTMYDNPVRELTVIHAFMEAANLALREYGLEIAASLAQPAGGTLHEI